MLSPSSLLPAPAGVLPFIHLSVNPLIRQSFTSSSAPLSKSSPLPLYTLHFTLYSFRIQLSAFRVPRSALLLFSSSPPPPRPPNATSASALPSPFVIVIVIVIVIFADSIATAIAKAIAVAAATTLRTDDEPAHGLGGAASFFVVFIVVVVIIIILVVFVVFVVFVVVIFIGYRCIGCAAGGFADGICKLVFWGVWHV